MSILEQIQANTEAVRIGKQALAQAIINKGTEIVNPNNPTFSELVTGVNAIESGGQGIKLFGSSEELNEYEGTEGELAVVYSNKVLPFTQDSTIQVLTFPDVVVLDVAITNSNSAYLMKEGTTNDRLAQLTLTKTAFRVRDYTTYEYVAQYTSTDGITYTRTSATLELDLGTPAVFSGTWNDAYSKFFQTGSVLFEGMYQYSEGAWELANNQFTVNKSADLLPNKIAYGKNGVVVGDDTFYDNTFNRKILTNVIADNNIQVDDTGLISGAAELGVLGRLKSGISGFKNYQLHRLKNANSNNYLVPYVDSTTVLTEKSGTATTGDYPSSGGNFYWYGNMVLLNTRYGNLGHACAVCEDNTVLYSTYSISFTRTTFLGGFVYNGNIYVIYYSKSSDSGTFSGTRIYKLTSTSMSQVHSTTQVGYSGYPKYLGFVNGIAYIYESGKIYCYNVATNSYNIKTLSFTSYNGTFNKISQDDSLFALTYSTYPYTYFNAIRIKADGTVTEITLPEMPETGVPSPLYVDDSGSEPVYYLVLSGTVYQYSASRGYTTVCVNSKLSPR